MTRSSLTRWARGRPHWNCAVRSVICGLLAAAVLQFFCLLPSSASDLGPDSTAGSDQQGRFLRLGLAKSAVVKLPAAAKDVIVGDNAIVDVVIRNRNTAYLFARSAGQTNVFFFDAEGREILQLDLEVTVDSRALKQLLDRSLPGNKIEVDSTGSSIVLKGMVASAEDARMAENLATRFAGGTGGQDAGIVNLLKIAQSDQVLLKVRIVELKRTVLKNLGINIDASFSFGALDFAFKNSPVSPLGSLGERLLNTSGAWSSGGTSVEATLQALEKNGLATTLAEPTLTAVSGAAASFLAGGEFPYTVCDETDTLQSCTVQFKPYGVSLGFTPTVLSEGRIALNINTEVSELGKLVLGVPSIDTRKAQTSVEMPSGGSMMMAGLIKDLTLQDLKGTPGLKSLPVLGALFSSREYQKDQTELVVIVTAYTASPVSEKQLATPLDGYNDSTDLQQIFLGRLNRVYGLPGDAPNTVYHGRVGHIID